MFQRHLTVGFVLAQTEVLQGMLDKLVRGEHLASWIIEKATVERNIENLFHVTIVCFNPGSACFTSVSLLGFLYRFCLCGVGSLCMNTREPALKICWCFACFVFAKIILGTPAPAPLLRIGARGFNLVVFGNGVTDRAVQRSARLCELLRNRLLREYRYK